jgi:hypothetical protein
MTIGTLAATIRQVPGVSSVRRWWGRNGEERLYITFSVVGDIAEAWVSLRDAGFGARLRETEADSSEQALKVERLALETIRALVGTYRAERKAELSAALSR